MALSVNTNTASLNTQRNLANSSSALNTSLQRLSTGSRINSAKDDAAGLQISNRLSSQINGLDVAVKNASDGISMAQVAEGALEQSTEILQRMRVLALQAANGSNGISELEALNAEFQELMKEFDRISSTTSFGGKKLLDGSFGTTTFQVGPSANETISMEISEMSSQKLIPIEQNWYSLALPISVSGIVDPDTWSPGDSSTPPSGNIHASFNITVDGKLLPVKLPTIDSLVFTGSIGQSIPNQPITLDWQPDENHLQQIYLAIEQALRTEEMEYILLAEIVPSQGISPNTLSLSFSNNNLNPVSLRGINIENSEKRVAFERLADFSLNKAGYAEEEFFFPGYNRIAQNVIAFLDKSIQAVDAQRAELGAIQNRFEHTIQNLQTMHENISSSRGRIQDTDYAAETAILSKNQIMQQAGTAILAQANVMPQAILSLLS